MSAKIRAAVAARRDPDFVIVARTDARTVEGFDAAVRRAHDYLAAGADMIFPEALESVDEFARFAREVPAPLLANMTEFGRSPLIPFDELAALGFRAAIYPLTAFRAAMRAAEETLSALREHGTQRDLLDRMQTRAELYDLLGYSDWEQRDQAYFTAGATGRRAIGSAERAALASETRCAETHQTRAIRRLGGWAIQAGPLLFERIRDGGGDQHGEVRRDGLMLKLHRLAGPGPSS